jgi:hypothetical protein
VYGSLENLDLETWRPGDLETWRPGDLEMYKPHLISFEYWDKVYKI